MSEEKRDYLADLAICEAVPKGQWKHERDMQGNDKIKLVFEAIYINDERIIRLNCDNAENIARFIALARIALPWYIRRCMALEEELEIDRILRNEAKKLRHNDAMRRVVEAAREVAKEWDIWLLREYPRSEKAKKRVRLLEALVALEGGQSCE